MEPNLLEDGIKYIDLARIEEEENMNNQVAYYLLKCAIAKFEEFAWKSTDFDKIEEMWNSISFFYDKMEGFGRDIGLPTTPNVSRSSPAWMKSAPPPEPIPRKPEPRMVICTSANTQATGITPTPGRPVISRPANTQAKGITPIPGRPGNSALCAGSVNGSRDPTLELRKKAAEDARRLNLHARKLQLEQSFRLQAAQQEESRLLEQRRQDTLLRQQQAEEQRRQDAFRQRYEEQQERRRREEEERQAREDENMVAVNQGLEDLCRHWDEKEKRLAEGKARAAEQRFQRLDNKRTMNEFR